MSSKKGKRQYVQPGYKREVGDESFEQLLNESFIPVRQLQIGEEVEASVIGFNNDHVFLDLKTRLDGVVRKPELMRDGKLMVQEGDMVKVFITGQRDGIWQCSCRLLSADKDHQDRREQDPQKVATIMALEEAYNKNLSVDGNIIKVTKGGFEVQVSGLKAFCPLSQIDNQYCENPEGHLNKTYSFKILQFEDGGTNIIVSRREYLDQETRKKADKLWQQVEVGRVYKGAVTAVQDYGAFVNIGGIEGLLHISEISYERIKKAGDKIKVGDQLDVAIKEIDREKRKLSFSLKSLQEDPWTATVEKLKIGTEWQGKIVRLKTYGAFVELFPGVDGMIHVSKLGTDRLHRHPKEILKIGDMVTVRVLEVDKSNRRISLTMEKEEVDYTQDLAQLKEDQEKSIQASTSHLENAFDQALEKKS